MTSTDPEDPIADALLGDSTYERLRARRYALVNGRIPRKLAWQSAFLLALALVVPITATYPAPVQAAFPSGDPLWSTPLVLWFGVYAGVIQIGSATCLMAVTALRCRHEPQLSESQATTLLNVEDVASMFGLVTGGFAVVLTLGFFLVGHFGAESLEAFVDATPRNPYRETAVAFPVVAVGAAATACSAVVYLSSRYLAARLP